ncbi:putative acetyltransferase [Sphingobium indicum BiD32]|jgi:ribosomal protein S18 acetylase RimI-like enzyme|uniref:Acetyltransferase n=2 Tax=Sphingobium TaxID=165695 RepID=N1MR24_9SPHN|nr:MULTISPECIES: GNAT family acetyltransferase [Sphingomonadales]MBA4757530.1 GNAT family acetyltransferase [Sphingosinicella sp.]GBH31584.1 hypothetical protein MBESOW_P2841 [Sphingobium xenophagum]CCW19406.1 putative acetyltransferase [Sphingobium indicum BiD32]
MTIELRTLVPGEVGDAARLWDACGLTRPWNDAAADARKALDGPASTIIGAFAGPRLIGTAMCGWDGHRGWIYYLGVDADFRRWGIGRKLIGHCEEWLGRFGALKVQLMVRADNADAARFYEAIGYDEDAFRFFYRRITRECHREQQSEAP